MIKIEAGKYYRNGYGVKIGPMKYVVNQHGTPMLYCWRDTQDDGIGGYSIFTYDDKGQWSSMYSNYNLLSEWEEKTPPDVDPTKTIIMEGCIYDRLLDNAIIQANDERRDHDGAKGNTSCKGMTAKDAMKKYGFVEGYYRLRKINTAPSMGSAPKVDLQGYEMEQLRKANKDLLDRCVELEANIKQRDYEFRGLEKQCAEHWARADKLQEEVSQWKKAEEDYKCILRANVKLLEENKSLKNELLVVKKLEPPTLQNTRQIYIGEILEEGDFHYSLLYNNLFRQVVPSVIGQRAVHNEFRRRL